jgi:hypothetical protein
LNFELAAIEVSTATVLGGMVSGEGFAPNF